MVSFSKEKRQALFNMIINVGGLGISLLVLHFFVFPQVAKKMDSDEYGLMQSLSALMYVVSGTLGSALSTTRLIKEYEYKEKGITADFSYLAAISAGIVLLIQPIVTFLYVKDIGICDNILVTLIGVANFFSAYFIVGFQIKLDYFAILIDRIIACLGYIVGYFCFCIFGKWQFIYIASFLFESIYCLIRTGMYKEPFSKSEMFKTTRKSFIDLNISNLFARFLTYFDKLLLYPLLGGTAVSIYFTANVFGKLVIMTTEPITNVILAYLSKRKNVSKATWKQVVIISGTCCLLMYIVCILISRPILMLLYPQWTEQAIKLVPITTLSLALSSFISILTPLTLKTVNTNRQIIINGAGVLCYIVGALTLYGKYRIMGCCMALLFSYLVKIFLIFALCRNEVLRNA